jgi:pSer/pThr/pTyr-binding forkhead associated (FHA) protein
MSALQPTDPGANARPRSPSSGGPVSGNVKPPGAVGNTLPQRPSGGQPPIESPGFAGARSDAQRRGELIDPQAATMASDGPRPNFMPSGAAAPVPFPQGSSPQQGSGPVSNPAVSQPRPASGPQWGIAVLVNRDGTDGQRFPLSGEYLVVGRAGADIAFDDDRFLARQHARIERGADGTVKVLPIDLLNGVFRKADVPVDLVDGMIVLVGREVLRFERVDPEEAKVHPLVRHGVALFGSPPREPWGRLMQIIPSGGYRDVRHLVGEEVVLGREEGDIVFRDDAFMSRRHAAVTWNGKVAQITDLGSSNGTFVRVTVPTTLKHGDHVRMGDQLLRIELGRV